MLKEKLIQRIQKIENEDLLKEIIDLIDFESNSKDVFQLSDNQKNAIENGIQSIESEGSHSNEEAKRIVEEWFKKK
ncbi:hypothetical protein ABWH96_14635 [Marivirga tractuosa]|jgi:hypothetical protein|uniref:hypothetical protein n=1 Tax=Marivirga tractuosa TaxID=1006 RepID=UPI0035D0F708